MKHIRLVILALCLIAWTPFSAPGSTAETNQDVDLPATIAVLPFVMYTPEKEPHIQQGVMTMLNTRLSWPNRIQVVPRQKIAEIMDPISPQNRSKVIHEVARKTGSQYVLDGSITQMAGSFSIDAVVYDILNRQHMTFFEQSDNSDELIDKISRIAAGINKQVFDRSTTDWERIEQERQAKSQELRRRHPEHLMQNPQWQQTKESPGWKKWKYLF